jgi:hypothetical protein
MKSWNSVKKALLEFSRIHPLVNSFGTGRITDTNSAKIVNFVDADVDRIYYPLVFASPDNATLNSGFCQLNCGLFFMDKVEEFQKLADGPTTADGVDLQQLQPDEIMSDMLQLATDYVAQFTNNYDLELVGSPSVTFFDDVFSDRVAGCRVQFNLAIPFGPSICAIPSSTGPFWFYYGATETGIIGDFWDGNSFAIRPGIEIEIDSFDSGATQNMSLWFAIPSTISVTNWRRSLIDRGLISTLFNLIDTTTHNGVVYDVYISNWQTNATTPMTLY